MIKGALTAQPGVVASSYLNQGNGMKDFDTREFRTALSGFSTGVTIVTAVASDGEKVGMTASSFNSVSTEPPLILWSVTKAALSANIFRDAKHFAVHVLASDQIHLSNQFATSGADKFSNVEYTQDTNDIPILKGCVARFDCSSWAVHEGGDHWVIIGEVQSIARENKEGLVFSDGSYAIASPVRPAKTVSTEQNEIESPIDNLLIYNLARAYRQMSSQFHNSVRDSGLTIPAWRILASLYGNVSRDLPELEVRTFLDTESLSDALVSLQQDGLCIVDDTEGVKSVTGTPDGHKRVEHLFTHGAKLDKTAVGEFGDKGLQQLITMLSEVVRNTNKLKG